MSIILLVAFQSPEIKPDPTANKWQALLEDDHAQFWDVYIVIRNIENEPDVYKDQL